MFNTGRQVGGALTVAVFGALLAHRSTFPRGLRISLLLAAVIALAAAGISLLLKGPYGRGSGVHNPASPANTRGLAAAVRAVRSVSPSSASRSRACERGRYGFLSTDDR